MDQKSDARGGRAEDACAALCSLLDALPPGHAAWTLPIEPFFAEPIRTPTFAAASQNWPITPANIR